MADTVPEQEKILKKRAGLCGDDIANRMWSPRSVKTFVNAIAAAFKEGGHPQTFVPSS